MVSIRSAAFFWLCGTSIINIFLGLLSIWLILYLGITGYFHITLFFESLEADTGHSHRNDEGSFERQGGNSEVNRARLARFYT